jgi:Flp pilus assembly protein TadB
LLATVVTINSYVITISTRDMYVALGVVILELTGLTTYFIRRHRRRHQRRELLVEPGFPRMVPLPRLDDHREATRASRG